MHWEIENMESGLVLGVYQGASPNDALEALARDAGYDSLANAPGDASHLRVTRVRALAADISTVGIGPRSQALDTGILAAGTLVRRLQRLDYHDEVHEGPIWRFLASTDNGATWHRQRAYSEPELS